MGANVFPLEFPPCISIYNFIDVDNLNIFKASMINEGEEYFPLFLEILEYPMPYVDTKSKHKIVRKIKLHETQRGIQELLIIGLKCQVPIK